MANKKATQRQNMLLSVLLFGIILIIVTVGSFVIIRTAESDQMANTKRNIDRAIVHCYALEGQYPPSVEYLEKNYGIVVNHEKYYINYDVFASNVYPTVQIFRKTDATAIRG